MLLLDELLLQFCEDDLTARLMKLIFAASANISAIHTLTPESMCDFDAASFESTILR